MSSSAIFESLPPQVKGPTLGVLSLKVRSLKLKDAGAVPVNYSVSFEFWGQQGQRPVLAVPWKGGMVEDEAIFPLRAEQSSVEAYLDDMKELVIDVLDSTSTKVGRATISLTKLTRRNLLAFDEPVSVFSIKSGGGKKIVLGEICMVMKISYDGSSSLLLQNEGEVDDSKSAKISDQSPARGRGGGGKDKNCTLLSSFQRNEALVHTDNSNKFSEWPEDAAPPLPPTSSEGTTAEPQQKVPVARSVKKVMSNPRQARQHQQQAKQPLSPGRGAAAVAAATTATTTTSTTAPPAKAPLTTLAQRAAQKKRDAKALEEEAALKIAASLPPPPPPSSGKGVDSLLLRAEGLLKLVQSVSPHPREAATAVAATMGQDANLGSTGVFAALDKLGDKGRSTSSPLFGEPGQRIFSMPPMSNEGGGGLAHDNISVMIGGGDPNSNLTQIDWLIRGIPEAYETEPDIDDESVRMLMKEGGEPPSALLFPSLYAATQRAMNRLSKMRILQVQIQQLIIYSARFGVRKDSSHLLVRPPLGCTVSKNESSSRFVSLPELEDTHMQYGFTDTALKKSQSKGLLKDYYVGACDLHKSETFQVQLDDKILRSWMAGGRDGSVRIELHSYLYSPANTSKGHRFSEAVLFGYVDIPLGGLLGTDALDAGVTCELEAESSTIASVLNRMHSTPFGHQMIKAKPLGHKMGSVSVRLSLLEHQAGNVVDEPAEESKLDSGRHHHKVSSGGAHAPPASTESLPLIPKSALLSPQPNPQVLADRQAETVAPIDKMHEAFYFQPQEAPKQSQVMSLAEDALPGFLGVVIYGARDLDVSTPSSPKQLVISYKVTSEIKEVIQGISLEQRDDDRKFFSSWSLEPTAKIYPLADLQTWKPPILEVWVHFTPSTGTHPNKILLGLAKISPNSRLGDVLDVSIEDIKTGFSLGNLLISLHLHELQGFVEDTMHRAVSMFISHPHRQGPSSHQALFDWPTFHADEEFTPSATLATKVRTAPPSPSRFRESAESLVSVDSLSHLREDQDAVELGEDFPSSRSDVVEEDKPLGGGDLSGAVLAEVEERSEKKDAATLPSTTLFISTDEDEVMPILDFLFHRSTHILDISIEGTCDPGQGNAPFGCYLVYSLPQTFIDEEEKSSVSVLPNPSMSALWWDGDRAVLNGRQRHKFTVKRQASVSALCFPSGIEMQVFECDDEGSMPKPDVLDSHLIGTAHIEASIINDVVSQAGCSKVLALPICIDAGKLNRIAVASTILVSLSHRLEPITYHSLSLTTEVSPMSAGGGGGGGSGRGDGNEGAKPKGIEDSVPSKTNIGASELAAGEDHLTFSGAAKAPLSLPPRRRKEEGGICVYVSIEEVAHIPSSLLELKDRFLVCACSSVGPLSASLRPDIQAFIPGTESFVTAAMPLAKSVYWDEGHTTNVQVGHAAAAAAAEASSPAKALRSAAVLVSVYVRQSWRMLSAFDQKQQQDMEQLQIGDQLLGAAAVDLSALSFGMPFIQGWYHLLDSTQSIKAQVKLSVRLATDKEVEEPLELPGSACSHVATSMFPSSLTSSYRSEDEVKSSHSLNDDASFPSNTLSLQFMPPPSSSDAALAVAAAAAAGENSLFDISSSSYSRTSSRSESTSREAVAAECGGDGGKSAGGEEEFEPQEEVSKDFSFDVNSRASEQIGSNNSSLLPDRSKEVSSSTSFSAQQAQMSIRIDGEKDEDGEGAENKDYDVDEEDETGDDADSFIRKYSYQTTLAIDVGKGARQAEDSPRQNLRGTTFVTSPEGDNDDSSTSSSSDAGEYADRLARLDLEHSAGGGSKSKESLRGQGGFEQKEEEVEEEDLEEDDEESSRISDSLTEMGGVTGAMGVYNKLVEGMRESKQLMDMIADAESDESVMSNLVDLAERLKASTSNMLALEENEEDTGMVGEDQGRWAQENEEEDDDEEEVDDDDGAEASALNYEDEDFATYHTSDDVSTYANDFEIDSELGDADTLDASPRTGVRRLGGGGGGGIVGGEDRWRSGGGDATSSSDESSLTEPRASMRSMLDGAAHMMRDSPVSDSALSDSTGANTSTSGSRDDDDEEEEEEGVVEEEEDEEDVGDAGVIIEARLPTSPITFDSSLSAATGGGGGGEGNVRAVEEAAMEEEASPFFVPAFWNGVKSSPDISFSLQPSGTRTSNTPTERRSLEGLDQVLRGSNVAKALPHLSLLSSFGGGGGESAAAVTAAGGGGGGGGGVEGEVDEGGEDDLDVYSPHTNKIRKVVVDVLAQLNVTTASTSSSSPSVASSLAPPAPSDSVSFASGGAGLAAGAASASSSSAAATSSSSSSSSSSGSKTTTSNASQKLSSRISAALLRLEQKVQQQQQTQPSLQLQQQASRSKINRRFLDEETDRVSKIMLGLHRR